MVRSMMPESEDPAGGTAGRGTAIALFFAANVLFGSGLFFHAFLYNFYIEGVGHAENVMGVAAAAISAGGLLALIPAGIVVDRFGTATAYVLSALLTAAGLTAGALVRAPFAIYLAAAAAGAGAGAWRVTMAPALLRIAPPGLRSRAFSWNTAFLVGSGAIWTAAAGAAATRLETVLDTDRAGGLRAALLLGAVATISAAALGAAILRTRRRTSAKRNEAVAGRTSRTPFAATMDGAADRVRPESEPAAEGGRQSPPAMAGASPESSPEPTERPATDSAGLIGSRLSGGLRQLSIPRRVALLILGTGVVWTAGALALPFYNIYFRRVHGLGIERIGLILGVGQVITAAAVFASGEGAARLGPRRMLTGWLLLFPPALWGLAGAGRQPPRPSI